MGLRCTRCTRVRAVRYHCPQPLRRLSIRTRQATAAPISPFRRCSPATSSSLARYLVPSIMWASLSPEPGPRRTSSARSMRKMGSLPRTVHWFEAGFSWMGAVAVPGVGNTVGGGGFRKASSSGPPTTASTASQGARRSTSTDVRTVRFGLHDAMNVSSLSGLSQYPANGTFINTPDDEGHVSSSPAVHRYTSPRAPESHRGARRRPA